MKKALKIILPLLLGGFLVWYSLSNISLNTLWQYFKAANYSWVVLGVFFGVLSHLSRAYRWKFMLEPMGYEPKLGNSFMAVFIAYLVNLAIPRAGEVSRALVMTNYEKIPFEKGFGTIVAERIADLVMMFIIIGITLFLQFDFIISLVSEKFNPIKIVFILFVLAVLFFLFSRYIKKAESGFGLKIKTFITGLIEGVTSIFKMKNKWAFIFHTVFIWFLYVVMFWVTIFAIEDFSVPMGAVLIGFIAGGFAMAATNGGLGAYPVAVTTAFTLFGVVKESANAFGWIMWSAQTAMIIVLGGLSFLILPVYNKNKKV